MAPHIAAKALTVMLPPGTILHGQQKQLSGAVGSYRPTTDRAGVWLQRQQTQARGVKAVLYRSEQRQNGRSGMMKG